MTHGTYWTIEKGQDPSKVYTDHGTRKSDTIHTIPLRTIEAPKPFSETEERYQAVRYFEPRWGDFSETLAEAVKLTKETHQSVLVEIGVATKEQEAETT